jgi:enterochelin esterase family protein
MKIGFLVRSSLATIVLAAALAAQAPQGPPAAGARGEGPGGPRVNSPEVLPDHRITFRFSAPKASEVVLRFGEGNLVNHNMTKGADGVWSVTIGPIEPDIYSYSFLVDGVKNIDLNNPMAKYAGNIDSSTLEMWDGEPRYDQIHAVPHGSINIHTYTSTVEKAPRGLYVYLPAEYYSQPNKRYPVLYLWHGGGGTEGDWSRHGRMGVILDNLIAQKKATPMIVVAGQNNPGTPVAGYRIPAGGRGNAGPEGENYTALKNEIATDIIPFIAGRYRTIENRENRAIAGLSAGGAVGFIVGLSNLDMFANVGEFSTGIFGGVSGYADYDIEKISPGFYKDIAATNRKLKTLFMSCGTEDPRFPFQKKAFEDIQKHGVKVEFTSYSGGHEWRVFRRALNDFTQRIFQ